MRRLNLFSRRRFGILLGAKLALLAGKVTAGDGQVHQVRIHRFRFEPEELTINPGDTVVWTNQDSAPHTATGKGSGWDTGQLDKGQDGSAHFDAPGNHAYSCRFHPHMKGKITVSA